MGYEWDENKRQATLIKHGIDFRDAALMLERPCLVFESPNKIEPRLIAVGEIGGKLTTVIYTVRGGKIRLVTARRARRDEERKYRALFA